MFSADLNYEPVRFTLSIIDKVNAAAAFTGAASDHSESMTDKNDTKKLTEIDSVILSNSIYFLKFKLSFIEAKKAQMRLNNIEHELLQAIEKFLIAVKTVQPQKVIEQRLFEVSSLWIKANRQHNQLNEQSTTQGDFFERLRAVNVDNVVTQKETFLERLNREAKNYFGECFALFVK